MMIQPKSKASLYLEPQSMNHFLEDWERGVKVSFEVDHKGLLEELSFDPPSATVQLKTQYQTYELDVSQVDPEDLEGCAQCCER